METESAKDLAFNLLWNGKAPQEIVNELESRGVSKADAQTITREEFGYRYRFNAKLIHTPLLIIAIAIFGLLGTLLLDDPMGKRYLWALCGFGLIFAPILLVVGLRQVKRNRSIERRYRISA
jgi:hypothetical protein